MKQQTLRSLFSECIYRHYRENELGVSWDIERRGTELRIFFQASNGTRDWIHNLTAHAAPYTDMQPPWQCHAGFLKCWESVRPILAEAIGDESVQSILTVGYSHGAALALLCHEYAFFHRPTLRERIVGVGFGCPRVLYGCVPPDVASRWKHFYVIRNGDDLVTHLPPRALGYCHVGSLVEIGEKGAHSALDDHRPTRYLESLRKPPSIRAKP